MKLKVFLNVLIDEHKPIDYAFCDGLAKEDQEDLWHRMILNGYIANEKDWKFEVKK